MAYVSPHEISITNAPWSSRDTEIYTQEQYAYYRSINIDNHDILPHSSFEQVAPLIDFYQSCPSRQQLMPAPYCEEPHETAINAPWPGSVDEFQRQESPDSSIFSSSSSPHAPGEISPRIHIVSYSYGSSATQLPQNLSHQHLYKYEEHVSKWRCGGGDSVIALNQIQRVADEQDVPVNVECLDDFSNGTHPLTYKAESYEYDLDLRYVPDREDSGVGESIRDAESVIYASEKESSSEDDKEYTPRKRQATFRRRGGSQTSSGSTLSRPTNSTTRSPAGRKRDVQTSAGHKRKRRTPTPSDLKPKPFTCCLYKYGCKATFPTKNEWKRHVATKHIQANNWRCDICIVGIVDGMERYNDFNRKDLFTQHLRRMHREGTKNGVVPTKESGIPPVTDETMGQHQERCHSTGEGSWEKRMEHVGKHLEEDRTLGKDPTGWRPDARLEKYLEEEGLVERRGNSWVLGDGITRREELDDEENDRLAPTMAGLNGPLSTRLIFRSRWRDARFTIVGNLSDLPSAAYRSVGNVQERIAGSPGHQEAMGKRGTKGNGYRADWVTSNESCEEVWYCDVLIFSAWMFVFAMANTQTALIFAHEHHRSAVGRKEIDGMIAVLHVE
ncbi:hypothetical protein EJ05DRAFT_487600 [Pseudovirgaria hyperparasitica]|uniref:C2H2-type domain-containing protein n=1 Tax=Pseudovirgaria hyperparasitica TaxID=470096 RepID=A0A6A6W451_9PEZI|nr:uncharacterized protein EJ05DRAFT_487600 [Pseudovirgaria hyperparasitica]KAF2756746.1 hypothetical protein EJ05DRAFT_487600 [Pseudovirgaria hyperparasitica]